jgi:ATP-dependent exoDNAse (exonuclease V) beta subunit
VARLFAYEVGLDPDFSLYEGELSPEGQALQNEMVRRAFNAVDARASKELLDVFDIQERFVAETRPLSQQWKEFWQTYASILENNPKGWGDLEAVGVEPSTKREPVQDLVARAQELIDLLRQDKSTDKRQVTQLQRILDGYHVKIDSLHQLKHQWEGDWGAEKNLECCAVQGALTSYGKTLELADELQTIFNRLLNDMVSRDLLQAAQHTKSLYQALSALKQAETQLRKETGLISFDGVTRALSEAIGGNLSVRNPEAFYVAYRLDSAIRHLMIDEFQDTSTSQWHYTTVYGRPQPVLSENNFNEFFFPITKFVHNDGK